MAVGDAVNRVVGPVKSAGLNGRLEAGEYFEIRRFSVPASVASRSVHGGAVARTLVCLNHTKKEN